MNNQEKFFVKNSTSETVFYQGPLVLWRLFFKEFLICNGTIPSYFFLIQIYVWTPLFFPVVLDINFRKNWCTFCSILPAFCRPALLLHAATEFNKNCRTNILPVFTILRPTWTLIKSLNSVYAQSNSQTMKRHFNCKQFNETLTVRNYS